MTDNGDQEFSRRAFPTLARLFAFIVGGIFCAASLSDAWLMASSSDPPTQYSLAELERGLEVTNAAATLGSHYACYDGAVYRFESREPHRTRGDFVKGYWYPILSQVPEEGAPINFRVVVAGSDVAYVGELPQGWEECPLVTGMFMRGIFGLNKEQRHLIATTFPQVDVDRLLLFEPGRKRPEQHSVLMLMVGGVALILGGFFWRRKTRINDPKMDGDDLRPAVSTSE